MYNPETVPFTFIGSTEGLAALDRALDTAARVAVDTETHNAVVGFNGMWLALRVISLAVRQPDDSLHAFVIDVRDIDRAALGSTMWKVKAADGWNANFDDTVLRTANCPVQFWRDAMHTDGVLHTGSYGFDFWHGLAFAARKYLGVELAGKGTTQVSFDAATDLTDEQVAYAAQDAVITLWVAEHLDRLVDADEQAQQAKGRKGLRTAVTNEHAARPFLMSMTEHGIPFDRDAWEREKLAEHREALAKVLVTMRELVGENEVATLFGETSSLPWNPESDAENRKALNEYATDAVKAFTGGRTMTRTDKLDKTTLKQIKHPLAQALLEYRKHAKVLSTYGENLDKYIDPADGRLHPQYKQGGVVATGRLASDKPNAQNLSPEMKPYLRPAPVIRDGKVVPRAIVYADLSQAELKGIAEESQDARMRELFHLGGDFHALTAQDMFHLDMASLKDNDPAEYSLARKKAKGVNFGIPYGLGAATLATNLTVNSGVPVTTAEAQAMLKAYNEAYPKVAEWLSVRDRYVRNLAENPGEVDWNLSLKLHELWTTGDSVRRKLKRQLGRVATFEELSYEMLPDAELASVLQASFGRLATPEESEAARAAHVRDLSWAFSFDAAVVLCPDGKPWTFESRSLTGRRRIFTVPMTSGTDKFEGVLTSAMLQVCTRGNEQVAALRAEFAELHGLDLPVGNDRTSRNQGESAPAFRARQWEHLKRDRVSCVKVFEGSNKALKYELYKFIEAKMGARYAQMLLHMSLGDQVRQMSTKYRNHPIQSLVADVGLEYYADLHERLTSYSDAFPIQAVHDSVAIECDLEEAPRLMVEVKEALERALARWCPCVPAVADADIRLSLADEDVIASDDVPMWADKLIKAASASEAVVA